MPRASVSKLRIFRFKIQIIIINYIINPDFGSIWQGIAKYENDMYRSGKIRKRM